MQSNGIFSERFLMQDKFESTRYAIMLEACHCHSILRHSRFSVIRNSAADFSHNFEDLPIFYEYAVGAAT